MSTEIKTGNMPVNISSNTAQKSTKSTGQAASTGQAQAQVSQSKATDTVSITNQVSRLQELETKLSTIPAVNEAKVAEIKASIADGSFEINPERIASKIIDNESIALDK